MAITMITLHLQLTTFQAKAREGASHPEQQAWKEENLMALTMMMQLMMMRLIMTMTMTFKMREWFSPFLERAAKQLVEIHMALLAR